jgi:hypothetical protein
MRLPNQVPNSERPIEINRFRMLVPQDGYCWLDDAFPTRALGEANLLALKSPRPYMVVQGRSTLGRIYNPFKTTPDLFQKFKDLSVDRDSLLRFANKYGWIGERGLVEYRGVALRAVGLSTWIAQIQKMTVADRLLNWVRIKDQQALSRYFVWHAKRFDVQVRIEMNGKTMGPITPASDHPERGRLCIWLVGGHIALDEVPELPELGWGRHDFTRPALVIAGDIINNELAQLCRPMLTMDDKNACLRGNWTAKNLLGCMWLQFYLSVIGQLKLRRCTVCGLEMDVTNSRSNKRVHETCSKTRRQARWRAGLKTT